MKLLKIILISFILLCLLGCNNNKKIYARVPNNHSILLVTKIGTYLINDVDAFIWSDKGTMKHQIL